MCLNCLLCRVWWSWCADCYRAWWSRWTKWRSLSSTRVQRIVCMQSIVSARAGSVSVIMNGATSSLMPLHSFCSSWHRWLPQVTGSESFFTLPVYLLMDNFLGLWDKLTVMSMHVFVSGHLFENFAKLLLWLFFLEQHRTVQ